MITIVRSKIQGLDCRESWSPLCGTHQSKSSTQMKKYFVDCAPARQRCPINKKRNGVRRTFTYKSDQVPQPRGCRRRLVKMGWAMVTKLDTYLNAAVMRIVYNSTFIHAVTMVYQVPRALNHRRIALNAALGVQTETWTADKKEAPLPQADHSRK